MKIGDNTVEVKESFIDFLPKDTKNAKGIYDMIIKALRDINLSVTDCRGQGYGNAATMAGIHSGVQPRLKKVNPKAECIACTNHSLNLVGVHAAGSSVNSVTFFGAVERLFTFFSASTHRWDILKEYVPITVKRIVETRWSAKHDAVKAIKSYYEKVLEALERLTE